MELEQPLRDFVSSNFYLADPASLDDRTSLPGNLDSIERIAAFVSRKKALLAETP